MERNLPNKCSKYMYLPTFFYLIRVLYKMYFFLQMELSKDNWQMMECYYVAHRGLLKITF